MKKKTKKKTFDKMARERNGRKMKTDHYGLHLLSTQHWACLRSLEWGLFQFLWQLASEACGGCHDSKEELSCVVVSSEWVRCVYDCCRWPAMHANTSKQGGLVTEAPGSTCHMTLSVLANLATHLALVRRLQSGVRVSWGWGGVSSVATAMR